MHHEISEREPLLRFFSYAHLRGELRSASERYFHTAQQLCVTTPRSAERTVALRKLLESKDAAVRSMLPERELSHDFVAGDAVTIEAMSWEGVSNATRRGTVSGGTTADPHALLVVFEDGAVQWCDVAALQRA